MPADSTNQVPVARNGVRSLLVERNPGLSPLPRATAVSTRTMELLRFWGLEEQVRAGQLDLNSTGAWAAETLASPDGAELPLGVAGVEQAAADLPVRVVAKGAFSFAAQVAERYREGRAFLAGDAAQRMTPRGGMGMNTAVAEAHDLAWKLAWVLNGWAGPGLLGSYEAEWRPVGARRTARSAREGAEPDGAGPSPRTSTAAFPTPGSPRPTAFPAPPSTSSAPASPSSPGPAPAPVPGRPSWPPSTPRSR
jgi:2-polyprenyl-6-methoxyphenol hydroxylase-like FAD-dependent oxidoreductase